MLFKTMQPQPLKIDRTKLVTPKNYAEREKMGLRTVYNKMKDGRLTVVEIDDVQFIQLA